MQGDGFTCTLPVQAVVELPYRTEVCRTEVNVALANFFLPCGGKIA